MSVHVEAIAPQEADEGLPQALGGLHGKVRRRRHGAEDRHARHGGLLNDLEAHPSGNHDESVVERQPPGEDLGADELVERVVATDVLADVQDATVPVEEARGVETARRVERRLSRPERVRQGTDHIRRDDGSRARKRLAADLDLVERGLAADPARCRRDEMAFGGEGGVEGPAEADDDGVVGLGMGDRVAEIDPLDLRAVDEALGAEEADGELRLVTRGAHRDRDPDRLLARSRSPDLERLLAHDGIPANLERAAPDGDHPRRRHVPGWNVARSCHDASLSPPRGSGTIPLVPSTSALTPAERAFLASRREAVLATQDPHGRPRLVPICFVLALDDDPRGRPRLYSPLDEKPKRSPDPKRLARVRDLLVLPEASLLVDRWSEDWDRLAWLRLYGSAELLEPEPREREEHAAAVAALRGKYEQYASHRLEERPIIRFSIERAVSWGDLGPD